MSILGLLTAHGEVLLIGAGLTLEQLHWKVFIQHGWWFPCSSISGVSFTKLSPGCVTSLPPLNLHAIREELHTIGLEK